MGIIIGSDIFGMKTSSSLLAIEQMFGNAKFSSKLKSFIISLIQSIAELSCHFHQSIMSKSGQLLSLIAS